MFGLGKKKNDEKLCPQFRAPCLKHGCHWYVHLYGTDPQDNSRIIDDWGCAIVFNVAAHLEVAKRMEGGFDGLQKATESARNEFVGAQKVIVANLLEIVEHAARVEEQIGYRPPMKEIGHEGNHQ